MPTSKPRLTVTLEPRTYEVLSRLSAAGGQSMASLVTQFVDLAVPSMERLVVVMERANSAPEEARAGLAAAIERAERTLMPAITQAQDMGDMFLGDLAEAAKGPEAGAGAARRTGPAPASPARSDPRLVTRGSGHPNKGRKGVKRG